jgi:hypothetical protein
MIVDFGVGQEALLLSFCDQQLELRLLVLVHHLNVSLSGPVSTGEKVNRPL